MTSGRIETAGDAGVEHRVLRDLAAMDDAAKAWRALEARAADPLSYFQGYDWCRRWIAAFGSDRCRPQIHTLRQGDRLLAVWPLMLCGGAFKRLRVLGAPHTQYANMLVDPALGLPEAGRLLLPAVRQERGHDVALFDNVPESAALARLLAPLAPLSGCANGAAMLDLSGFGTPGDYLAALSKTQRRNRNRRRNLLARQGELAFEVLFPEDAGFEPAVRTCGAFKRAWLAETGRRSSGFDFAGFDAFLASLGGSRGGRSGACLSVLTAGGRLVAGELGFLHHGHYYAYLGAFDWTLRDASPGKTQMDMTVCWLIEQGAATYDLLGNPADYKESWSNRTLRLETYAIPENLAGRTYADLWTARLRPGLKRLYETMPHQLRRLARFGQSVGLFLMIA